MIYILDIAFTLIFFQPLWFYFVDPKTKSFNIFLGVTAYSYNIQIRTRHRL